MDATEFDLLSVYVDRMEAEGKIHKLVRIGIDESLVELLAEKGLQTDLERLRRLADVCLAREWLTHHELSGQYSGIGITTTGVGVVRSRRARSEQLRNRSKLKVVSDYIEDHKGLFVALGASIALAGLLLKFFGGLNRHGSPRHLLAVWKRETKMLRVVRNWRSSRLLK